MFVVASLLITTASALSCAKFECTASLPANMCANRLNKQSFQINSNGCSEGYLCSIPALAAWVKNDAVSFYQCTPRAAWTPTVNLDLDCPAFQKDKNFIGDVDFLACATDEDCKMKDGSHTTCSCVLRSDGLGVCDADISNLPVFSDFWSDCGTETGGSQLPDQETAQYWTLRRAWFPWTQSNLLCNSVLEEMAMLDTAFAVYESSALLAASVLSLAI